jgi:hypothetical protein
MNLRGQSAAKRRLWVWAIGSTVALGYYLCQAIHVPRRIAVGIECPICGIRNLSATVTESPSGGRWFLALTTPEDPLAAAGVPVPPRPLAEALREFQWPGRAVTTRRLAPFEPTGTWRVDGSAVRWEWDLAADGWDGDGYVWARIETREGSEVTVHTLEGGAAFAGRLPSLADEDSNEYELIANRDDSVSYEQTEWDPELWSSLSSALEELPSDFAGNWKYGQEDIQGRGIYLVHTLAASGDSVALYAASDEPAPRILRLASGARPLALSRDGRTLFFERCGVLWRLDLRKPLPALLDEVSVPELPDPLAAR